MKTEWPYNPVSSSSSSLVSSSEAAVSSSSSSSGSVSTSAPPPLVSASSALSDSLCGEDFGLSSVAPPSGPHCPTEDHLVTDVPANMGLQPPGLHPPSGHLPPYMRPHSPEGLPAHHGHCTCQCRHLPQDRTILHSILTGQGYKFGYGSGGSAFGVPSSSPFLQTLGHYHGSGSGDQDNPDDLLLDLEPLDTKVPSQGTSSPSKYISQPPNK